MEPDEYIPAWLDVVDGIRCCFLTFWMQLLQPAVKLFKDILDCLRK